MKGLQTTGGEGEVTGVGGSGEEEKEGSERCVAKERRGRERMAEEEEGIGRCERERHALTVVLAIDCIYSNATYTL